MYDIFLDTEYADKGGDIFLISIRSTHGDEYTLYGANLRWNVIEKILRNKKRIFVYGPDIGKMEKQFNVDLKSRWICVNVLSIVREYLPDLPSKSLVEVEKFMKLERSTASFKKYTRNLDIHWKNKKKRAGIIDYNKEDTLFLELVYNLIHDVFKFDPDDFRILPK
ncbi:MAG TPA: ribonuclease H-like domain-containing protein [Bacteroidales bacterium]|jgi:hypothetical protein|nr:ribonuclease H-like domain-containing protein [Bacteroidales bacterium]HQP16225.1 ribonuclease H-like domain-containing protein [Bacteroidales bacterium]